MKRLILFSISAVLLAASCQKATVSNQKQEGYLSFDGMTLEVDDEVITKSDYTEATNYYQITIQDEKGIPCLTKYYKEIKESDYRITLPAGNYTLVASSTDEEVAEAAWENPVYGTTKDFTITAGEVTEIGQIICTLTQCKVTVDYSDSFLACVTGEGKTTVTIKDGYPLEYKLTDATEYVRDAGYFNVDGNTMTVVFQGSIDGKNQKMTKAFHNIEPKQWRQIKFIQKENPQGDATFDIVINQLVSDLVLNNTIESSEAILDPNDPEAPKGDGGITIYPDYEAGCDSEIDDLQNMRIVPFEERTMSIKLRAEVPNGIMKFTVDISTDNNAFAKAVAAAEATNLDLINPSQANMVIFDVVPFPNGPGLVGQTDVAFDLSNAQGAILNYRGNHTFTMTVIDQTGCRKSIVVKMIVE